MSAPSPDPLDALREQLERTQAAARDLAREAAEAARGAAARPPAAGWEVPGTGRPADDLDPLGLVLLADTIRGAVPPELWTRLVQAVRELLVVVRALIDFVVARLDDRREAESAEVEVEDIPIV